MKTTAARINPLYNNIIIIELKITITNTYLCRKSSMAGKPLISNLMLRRQSTVVIKPFVHIKAFGGGFSIPTLHSQLSMLPKIGAAASMTATRATINDKAMISRTAEKNTRE